MSGNNKQDKNAYAEDTLAYTVPPEARKNKQPNVNHYGQYPQGQYPQGQYPQGQYRPAPQRVASPNQRQTQPNRSSNSRGQQSQARKPVPNRNPPQRPQTQKNKQPVKPTQQRRSEQAARTPKQKQVKIKKKKGGCLSKILLSVISLILVVFIGYSVLVFSLIGKINIVDDGERNYPSHSLYSSTSVKNILLIGTDSRGEDRGRSDSMILLSINSKTNEINMVSLMRDTYVQVPGYGGCKLNAAYSYGGAELLMDTIEENFYIDIDDYVTVNFVSFANIVDAVGGVEIEVSDEEAEAINVLVSSEETNSFFGEPSDSDFLNGGGTYQLNGRQALCYSRLRKVGNADFERTERQRKVLSEMLKNVSSANPLKLSSVASEALPSMTTNMSKLDMYFLSLRLPVLLVGYDIQQLRIPAEDTYWNSTIDDQSVLEIDIDANLDIIENEIYGN